MPFGIQPWHLILIVIVALIIFGPSKLPDMGRSLGKTITEFRKGTQEMTQGFKEEVSQGDANPQPQVQVQPAPPPAASIPAQTASTPIPAPTVQTAVAVEAVAAAPAVEEAICPSCGVSNPATARFCLNCGTQIHA